LRAGAFNDSVARWRRLEAAFARAWDDWDSRRCSSKILAYAFEERMTQLALGGFSSVFDLGEQRRFDPNSPVRDLRGAARAVCALPVQVARAAEPQYRSLPADAG
jgi:hypothetical protein